MNSFRLTALALLLFVGCKENDPTAPLPQIPTEPVSVRGPSKAQSLVEARRAFKTKLTRQEKSNTPFDQPPPAIFTLVRYDSPVGKLGAYLSPNPKDGKKHPAIIWITGGDCNTIDKGCWTPGPAHNEQSARAFREAGIPMMFPSLRGGNDNPGVKEGFLGEIDDVLAAADFLAKQEFVDPKRIYLGGHSTGGTVVFLAAASSDRFRAVFSFGPADDVAGYGDEFCPFNFRNRQETEVRNPIRWVNTVQCPTFVFEGTINGNITALLGMQRASKNPMLRFFPIEGGNHFNILSPLTKLIAARILKDEGEQPNFDFTAGELEWAMKK